MSHAPAVVVPHTPAIIWHVAPAIARRIPPTVIVHTAVHTAPTVVIHLPVAPTVIHGGVSPAIVTHRLVTPSVVHSHVSHVPHTSHVSHRHVHAHTAHIHSHSALKLNTKVDHSCSSAFVGKSNILIFHNTGIGHVATEVHKPFSNKVIEHGVLIPHLNVHS